MSAASVGPASSGAASKKSAVPRRKAFVAGATGFTGRALAHQTPGLYGVDLTLQVRPGSVQRRALGDDERIVDIDLDDSRALADAMRGAHAVMQLIGTVRARFDDTTSYETVDYGTTEKLLEGARAAGVRHFILLSSVGAGVGLGSYLAWKRRTEQLVAASGVPYTILRPSYLAGDDEMTERKELPNVQAFFTGLSDTPVGAPFALLRPMPIQWLAKILLHIVVHGPYNRALGGAALFHIAREIGVAERGVAEQLFGE